jgi:hypothetical protein
VESKGRNERKPGNTAPIAMGKGLGDSSAHRIADNIDRTYAELVEDTG